MCEYRIRNLRSILFISVKYYALTYCITLGYVYEISQNEKLWNPGQWSLKMHLKCFVERNKLDFFFSLARFCVIFYLQSDTVIQSTKENSGLLG